MYICLLLCTGVVEVRNDTCTWHRHTCIQWQEHFLLCTYVVAPNGRRRSHQSGVNPSVSFLPPSQRESNLTHNRQSPSRSTGSASTQTQSAPALRKGASEGLCPDQPDGLVSPLRGILPSTSAALSPSKSVGSIQGDSTHPAAIGMENQPPVPTQSLNWTLSGYHQRQKARGDGGVQSTAPYLRLRQSCLGGPGGTLLSGNMGSNAVWSPSNSGLDCLHYSKYGSGASHCRWVHTYGTCTYIWQSYGEVQDTAYIRTYLHQKCTTLTVVLLHTRGYTHV